MKNYQKGSVPLLVIALFIGVLVIMSLINTISSNVGELVNTYITTKIVPNIDV